jgi:hypothetical protein
MTIKKVEVDTKLIDDKGSQCGSCHKPIHKKGGVVFGRSSLFFPAIYVCHNCVKVAMLLLEPQDPGMLYRRLKNEYPFASTSMKKCRRRS